MTYPGFPYRELSIEFDISKSCDKQAAILSTALATRVWP